MICEYPSADVIPTFVTAATFMAKTRLARHYTIGFLFTL
jgi:hypothetical protein